jgi:outer membrane protein
VRETKYWQWRTFKSNYQPQLSLSGILPATAKLLQQVLQPDGTVSVSSRYIMITHRCSWILARVSPQPGGTVYGTTQCSVFTISTEITCCTMVCLMLSGYSQPLFQFNALRWDKKIEPLKFNESKQAYIESQEQIAYYG